MVSVLCGGSRWIVQREIYLNEERRALQKPLDVPADLGLFADDEEVVALGSQLKTCHEELQTPLINSTGRPADSAGIWKERYLKDFWPSFRSTQKQSRLVSL